MDKTYYFDPCDLDDSADEEEVTLDNWKPTPKNNGIVQSEWRKKQIGTNFNQEPGIDELKKIEMYLKKNKADSEIMQAFGINAETLIAIKKNKYCPIDGISMDNLSKIYSEFKSIHNKLLHIQRATDYLSNILFIEEDDLKQFKDFCKTGKDKKKKTKKMEQIKHEESESLSPSEEQLLPDEDVP